MNRNPPTQSNACWGRAALALACVLMACNAGASNLVVTPAVPTAGAPFTLDFDVELSGCAALLSPPAVTVTGNTIDMLLGTGCIVSTQHSPVHFSAPVPGIAQGTYSVTWQVGYEPANNLSDPLSLGSVVVGAAVPVASIEYYNAALDHYFMTASPVEIAALDAGQFAGWQRTGQSFGVYAAGSGVLGTHDVCRYYGRPERGLDTHFYSAFAEECALVPQLFPNDWVLESGDVFELFVPALDGTCAPGLIPVYRFYNDRADANHRYTTSLAVGAQMIAKGWIAEGYGPAGVGMCAPAL